MRVDFVGHAALLLRLGRLTILTDPWWASPAFKGQWCPYPLPVTDGFDPRSLDAVYISHAHEDHLHRDTLREILAAAPDVLAVIPRRYDTLMRDYLVRIGFRNIREVASGTRIQLRKGAYVAKLRVFTHLDDSLLSVEYAGQVLLNANDALHSAPRELIEAYCRDLRRRLPRIDYLFCGFGGASYFPNCVHVPGKDDVAVARVREEFFLRNFALVAQRLQPRYAFPFAAHFVLPNEHNWWISARRLSMPPPSEIVRRVAPDLPTEVVDLQPGDWVEGGDIHASAYPGGGPEAARREVIARYGPPATTREIAVADFERLLEATRARVEQRIAAAPGTAALDAVFRLWDFPAAGIHIAVGDGRCQVSAISLDDLAGASPEVVFETRSDLLTATMRSPFGRDLIAVGYAAEVHLRSAREVASNAHERLLDLIAYAQPRWRQRFRKHPARVLGFLIGDASMRHRFKARLRPSPLAAHPGDPALYALGDWSQAADHIPS